MAKEEKKAPKLRFNGYTNDWEQVKLEKIATFSKGKGYSKLDLKRKGYPIFLYGQMYTNYRYKIVETSTYAILKEDAVVSNGNEIVIPSSGETSVDIARASWIAQKGIIIGSDLNIIRPTSSVHPLFLALSLSNNQVKYNLAKVAQGNSIVHLYNNNLKKVNIYFPNIVEQNRIGNILNSISNCINLHEDYLQLLYDFRSFLLQKMFSINDTFPNLRFKQFNDKWKYKKLGEVADIVSGGTPDTKKHDYWNGSINWYTPAEIGNKIFVSGSQRKITNIGLENSSAKILPIGTVLFTSRAGIGKTAILKEKGSTNQGFQSIVPKQKFLDSYFIFSMSNILKKYGESHGAGSTFLEISGKELAKAKISLPSITEQKHISKVLFKLDTIITFQKQEIDNLKKLKQFLLQNMFI
ncbi:restriction endonuclease subunit S [Ligilactobacillus salivarius]|uniref:restriction endonuclease subunit S n=2 Tax=Ligilactobacillus salivarius TaxID=1624 RepID=UPI001CBCD014|nr:restriction endonuclease subunit S [Ligilactobacillus salivarius]MBZ4033022.1 restriction endonuclease subunit S [Ligilactobacillus salivarius]